MDAHPSQDQRLVPLLGSTASIFPARPSPTDAGFEFVIDQSAAADVRSQRP